MNNEIWGMRFNPRPEYRRFSKSELGSDYPDWFEQREFDMHIEYTVSSDPPPPSGGTTLTFQPDGAAGLDTYLLSTSPNSNYGSSSDMGVGENNDVSNKYARGRIKFDLSEIPTNATIISATLSLWTSQVTH